MCLSQKTSGYKYPVLDQPVYQKSVEYHFDRLKFGHLNTLTQIVYVIKAKTDVISKDGRHHKPTSLHLLAN